jgi:aryl-alcohol dehydrogenase-like predicted oxidoreductase
MSRNGAVPEERGAGNPMKTEDRRPFGDTGLSVSPLGMGCARLGSIWQGRSDAESRGAVAAALDLGISFFDTADSYARGRSERILGDTVHRRRADVVIATKCGLLKTPNSFVQALVALRSHSKSGSGNIAAAKPSIWKAFKTRRLYAAEYIRSAAQQSCRRLRSDYVDVLLLHSPPGDVLLQDSLMEALHDLRRQGTIRYWGVSARSEEDAEIALGMQGIDCIEVPLSLCRRRSLQRVIPDAAAAGIAVIARQPFDSGSQFRTEGWAGANASPYASSSKETRSLILKAALQFALEAPGVNTVIAGMTRPQHVRENVAVLASEPLPREAIESLSRALCP